MNKNILTANRQSDFSKRTCIKNVTYLTCKFFEFCHKRLEKSGVSMSLTGVKVKQYHDIQMSAFPPQMHVSIIISKGW